MDLSGFSPATGWGRPAFEAAERHTAQTVRWNPPIGRSPDSMLLSERDLVLSRQQDAIRNNGIAAGYVQHRLDAVVGAGLKLMPRPKYRALGQTAEWADEFAREIKTHWQQVAEDPDCWLDYRRRLSFNGMLSQMYRSYVFNAELILVMEWRPLRERRQGAFVRTAVNVINPELLCNPEGAQDTDRLRGGVEMDDNGAPVAYWFRQGFADEGGIEGALKSQTWKRVPAYTVWGRRQVVHIYDPEHPGQTRGRPTFAAALLRLRMLDKFEKTALEAQILQAMYAAVIESSADPQTVAMAMGRGGDSSPLETYTAQQAVFAKGTGGVRLNGALVPQLLMGEKLKLLSPGNTAPNLDAFEHATLCHLSRALPGVSVEDLSGDYSKTSYSSARASSLAPWRFVTGQRDHIVDPAASAVYANVMEELIGDGRLMLPANAPSYYDAKTAWTACEWIGQPRGHIDDVKAQEANKLKREMGVLTHEDHCAEEGKDSDEVIERLAAEEKRLRAAGLPTPMDMLNSGKAAANEAASAAQKASEAQAAESRAAVALLESTRQAMAA